VRKPVDLVELKRREFFKRRCCSLQKKHLDKHYHEMLKLFYQIGADANLKHVFLTSIPKELSQQGSGTFHWEKSNKKSICALKNCASNANPFVL